MRAENLPVLCRGAAVLLVTVFLAGCGLSAQPKKEFSSTFKDYAERLRWRDYQQVADYLQPDYRQEFLQKFSALDGLHVVDARLESVDFSDDDARARTALLLEYYLLPSITVKKAFLQQEWVYQSTDSYHAGFWQLAGPFPPFP